MERKFLSQAAQAGQAILHTLEQLVQRRLVSGTWGNLSVRLTGSDDIIAITPSGKPYQTLRAEDMALVQVSTGEHLHAPFVPSSELPLHLAIYRQRPDVQALVHTHSIYATACAVARQPIPPIIEDLIQVAGGEIRVAQYALPGTAALADHAVQALAGRRAALLANHGVICCGRSLNEALLLSELVEKGAQTLAIANQLGGAVSLSAEDVATMHNFYTELYRTRQEG